MTATALVACFTLLALLESSRLLQAQDNIVARRRPSCNAVHGIPGVPGIPGLPGPRGPQGPPGTHCACQAPSHTANDPGSTADGGGGGNNKPPIGSTVLLVTQPTNVAFSVARSKSLGPLEQDAIITFDTIITNNGNAFNKNTGKFVSPVQGTFVFMFTVMKSTSSHILGVSLIKNTEIQASVYGDKEHDIGSNSVVLNLRKNDAVWMELRTSFALYSDNDKYTTFTGFLLFEDGINTDQADEIKLL